jgi:hypothetical protein
LRVSPIRLLTSAAPSIIVCNVKRCLYIAYLVVVSLAISSDVVAQVGAQANGPAPAQPSPLPFPAELKKAVIFIQTDCLHEPTAEELATLPPEEREKWTSEALDKRKIEDLAKLRHDSYLGTGFFVFVPDERVGKNGGFNYLVTNRHVAQPGIEDGKPCRVVGYTFLLNHKGGSDREPDHLQAVPFVPIVPNDTWLFSDDDSVDLAVTNFSVSQTDWDYQTIPLNLFVLPEMGDQKQIVEGDPVLFAGLFIQYAGSSKLEPIIRSGNIAMLPTDLIETTLKKPGRVYLAEAHAFGGNSGSPMFVDVNKFKGSIGFDYRFLGVVAGEVYETNDLTLQTTATYKGTLAANSNISMVVPAQEVIKILLSEKAQKVRDEIVARQLQQKK